MTRKVYQPRGVLAGAYGRGRRGPREGQATLTHYYCEGDPKTLCGRIKEDHLGDEYGTSADAVVDCPLCAERFARLAAKGKATRGNPAQRRNVAILQAPYEKRREVSYDEPPRRRTYADAMAGVQRAIDGALREELETEGSTSGRFGWQGQKEPTVKLDLKPLVGNPWLEDMPEAAWPAWKVVGGRHAGFQFFAPDEEAARRYVLDHDLGSRVVAAHKLRVLNPRKRNVAMLHAPFEHRREVSYEEPPRRPSYAEAMQGVQRAVDGALREEIAVHGMTSGTFGLDWNKSHAEPTERLELKPMRAATNPTFRRTRSLDYWRDELRKEKAYQNRFTDDFNRAEYDEAIEIAEKQIALWEAFEKSLAHLPSNMRDEYMKRKKNPAVKMTQDKLDRVMALVERHPGSSLGELSTLTVYGRPTIEAALGVLVADGRVSRARTTPHRFTYTSTGKQSNPREARMSPEFTSALMRYLATQQEEHVARYGSSGPLVGYDVGGRYVKVWWGRSSGGSDRSVISFVDTTDGTIYYPDGWKKHSGRVIGNIFKPTPALPAGRVLRHVGGIVKSNPRMTKVSDKAPKDMTGSQIKKEYEKLRAQSSQLTSEAIALGRGHWRYSDFAKAASELPADLFAQSYMAVAKRMQTLHIEAELRHGPGANIDRLKGGARKYANNPSTGSTDWNLTVWDETLNNAKALYNFHGTEAAARKRAQQLADEWHEPERGGRVKVMAFDVTRSDRGRSAEIPDFTVRGSAARGKAKDRARRHDQAVRDGNWDLAGKLSKRSNPASPDLVRAIRQVDEANFAAHDAGYSADDRLPPALARRIKDANDNLDRFTHNDVVEAMREMEEQARTRPARTNSASTDPMRIPAVRKAMRTYTSTHWGIKPRRVQKVNDPDLPKAITQMGTLQSIEVRDKGETLDLDFSKYSPACHVAFDPGKSRKLFNILTPAAEADAARRLITKDGKWYRINDLQREYGEGRQKRYPFKKNLEVQVLGKIRRVIYHTNKRENEASKGQGGVANYDHAVGEETKRYPFLCVDRSGRLWWVGGAYTVIAGGIKD